jgi:hypothetical protein
MCSPPASILKEKQTEQAEKKREKKKGKAIETELRRKASKKVAGRTNQQSERRGRRLMAG